MHQEKTEELAFQTPSEVSACIAYPDAVSYSLPLSYDRTNKVLDSVECASEMCDYAISGTSSTLNRHLSAGGASTCATQARQNSRGAGSGRAARKDQQF